MLVQDAQDKAIALGHPSYVWRDGQERRLEMIRCYAPLEDARVLDVGCGLGMYVQHLRAYSEHVHGVDVDEEKAIQAGRAMPNIALARAESLPYLDNTFDVVLLNEVLEHVDGDAQAVGEAWRVLRPGGRIVVFAPNRWYPFETHGIFWRGRYRFGNIPLVNYLPNPIRRTLCPHVRAYSGRNLTALFGGLAGRLVVHRRIFAGYDNVYARWPAVGGLLRRISYWLERTPFQVLGLSHLLVFEKASVVHSGDEVDRR